MLEEIGITLHGIYILNSLTLLALSVAAMATQEGMKKILRKLLFLSFAVQAAPVSTATGKPLVVEQTADNHFDQMRTAWK